MKLSLREVSQYLETALDAADAAITGWSIDSRTVQPSDLFFAIKGEKFDGHAFVEAAFEKGAAAAIVDEPVANHIHPVLTIEDTVSGLGKLAGKVRERWTKRVVAVTGSAGKTGTKEIIAACLATRLKVGKTIGNLNNHIGLPLSVLRIPDEAQAAVLEMGMNHAGEIRKLAEIARPDIGVVTNVGFAHIEAFSSIDGIAAAKRELIESLPSDGIAVLNADDARVLAMQAAHKGRVITYGASAAAEMRAEGIEPSAEGTRFCVRGVPFTTKLPGRHAVSNIMAGLAVASVFDISPALLVGTVAQLEAARMRGTRREVRGIAVLDDSYNSNPEAARAMIDVLREERAERRIAVLGEMLELGDWSERLHREVGAYAAGHGADVVIGVQGAARFLVDEAEKAGARAFFFEDAQSAGEFLRHFARKGDAMLFKGSRGAHVERALATMEG